jgi:hypothetical protein
MGRYAVFALWASVQILFVSVFVQLLWHLRRVWVLAKRAERKDDFVVSFLTTVAQRTWADPAAVQSDLMRCVSDYQQPERVATGRTLKRLWNWIR